MIKTNLYLESLLSITLLNGCFIIIFYEYKDNWLIRQSDRYWLGNELKMMDIHIYILYRSSGFITMYHTSLLKLSDIFHEFHKLCNLSKDFIIISFFYKWLSKTG